MREIEIEDGICKNKEDLHFEAKEAKNGVPRDAWDTYSAFANTDGGTIVFGLKEDDGQLRVVGIKDAEGMIQNIWNLLHNKEFVSSDLLSSNDLAIIDSNGCELIVMNVPRASRFDRPVFIHGNPRNTFKRNGEGDYKCTPDEIRAMTIDSANTPIDRTIIKSSEISDLNRRSIDVYRNHFKIMRQESELNDYDDETFLRMIGAASIDEGILRPTFAGLLMFGTDLTISLEINNFFLDYRQYVDDNINWDDRLATGIGNWSGNLFDFFCKTCRMISETIKHRMELDGESRRKDDNEIDKVVREALLNALANADYYGRGGIAVERRPGTLTIRNPGTFRIPLNVAENGGFSDPRNPTIMKMFTLIGFGEQAGSGILRMRNLCIGAGLPIPNYKENSRPDYVIIEIKTDNDHSCDNGDIIIDLILNDPKISITTIAERQGVDRNVVARRIERLKSEGVLERVGGTRGHWKVKPRVNFP